MENFQEWLHLYEQLPQMGPGGPPTGGPHLGMGGGMPRGDVGEKGISQPAHENDEEKMSLPTLIEKRLDMLLDEIEKKRRMPKAQGAQLLMQIVQAIAEKTGHTATQAAAMTRQAMQPAEPAQPVPQAPSPIQQQPMG